MDHQEFPLNFQMPQFVLGSSTVAHGGGAEVVPCMAWDPYDAFKYGHPGYFLDDEHEPDPARPGPFEFEDAPSMTPAMTPAPAPLVAPAPLSLPLSFPTLSALDPTAPLPPIPRTGLPLYSASGFDMLRILAKVATRPSPKIMLGPVDMTCSFCVVDVRRYDAPIVYASPTFTRLTGYPEREVLGRNCRFLQAPSGNVPRGSDRRFTAPDAVRHLQKSLLNEKECQASLINYRKDGGAFINLVTVIPIAADDHTPHEITHHVGFQVDLAEQPNAILQKLRDGSYIVNYSSATGADWLGTGRRGRGVSEAMVDVLSTFKATDVDPGIKPSRDHERAALHALLLENTDDFIHVVSLKGALLYVAPAIARVLGYPAASLVGKSIADICHPADVVPLMRELKEASALPAPAPSPPNSSESPPPLFALPQQQNAPPPKPVHLLFRAKHADGGYVWLESRGRLHVEQGKGRKAVVLVGRRTSVPSLPWRDVGGDVGDGVWGLVAPNGLVLSAPGGLARCVGGSVATLVEDPDKRRVVDVLAGAACAREGVRSVRVGVVASVRGGGKGEIIFYAAPGREGCLPPHLVFQLRLDSASSSSQTLTAHPSPDPSSSVLSALDTARETSWQYELTRLRFENERMREEIAALEGRLGAGRRSKTQQQQQRQQQPQLQTQTQPQSTHTHAQITQGHAQPPMASLPVSSKRNRGGDMRRGWSRCVTRDVTRFG